METGKVRFRICTGVTKEDEALEIFLEEANMIMETPEKELPTTLIAFPDLYSGDFLSWNDFALNIEDLLDEEGGWAVRVQHRNRTRSSALWSRSAKCIIQWQC
jgi:hypothetical protein